MERRAKWLWIVTFASVAVAALLILGTYGMMLALAVLAPQVSVGPVFVLLLPTGVTLSVVGLRLARGVASPASRRIGYVVNGSALLVSALILVGLARLFIGIREERFVIPEGYKGDVYVVYGAADGEPVNEGRGPTYRIPEDGILRVRGPMFRGWTKTEYFYQRKDGTLERIRNFWPSTIHRTPENLANDSDVGVFFPRTGGFTDSAGCSVKYQLFYVGTKAYLLTKYERKDIGRYLRDHPVGCSHYGTDAGVCHATAVEPATSGLTCFGTIDLG